MPGQDGSRAISTINFLLDGKAPGMKLEHTWNAHLKATCRDNARDSLNLLNLLKSEREESADATEGPTSTTALQDAVSAQDISSAGSSEAPRQQPLPAEAAAGGPAPSCPAGGPQAAPGTPAQDATAASTVQESANTTAATDSSLDAPSCTPQQLSESSGSKGSGRLKTVPALQLSSPAPEQPANVDPAGASTAAGPSTPALSPMQVATGVKPAAEAPTPPAQVAEEEGPEEYRAVHKAQNLLRHVQATTKLPECLQPPKRPQLMQPSASVPAASAAGSSSSSSSTGSVAMNAASSKPSAAAAGSGAVHKLSPAGDAVTDVLLPGMPSSSMRDSNSGPAGKLCLGADTSSASLNSLSSPRSSRTPTQQPEPAPQPQPHQQPQRCKSFSPAAALAAAIAPGSGAAPAALAQRHTNGAAITSSNASAQTAQLYEPTLEDLKPYLAGALSGEGLEAFIQRRLQQPPDVASGTGAKLAKLPATQRYMATIAVEHKQRQQLQRLPSAEGDHGRQRA